MKTAFVIADPELRTRLADALDGVCEPAEDGSDPFDGTADLLIVDAAALASARAALLKARREAEPLFLPVLFVIEHPDVAPAAPELWEAVDDLVSRSATEHELRARVGVLLRARSLSQRLWSSREHERRTAARVGGVQEVHRRERIVAATLQLAALPRTLPCVDGLRFDGCYVPAGDETRVGGDWYDALRLSDGRIVVSIGDVAGSGLEAAVTMASMRQALRAVAHVYADPATMLDAADRMLKLEQPHAMVTAFVGVLDLVAGTIRYATAGHPPPLVRDPDGTVVELAAHGLPLGLRQRAEDASAVVAIRPGSLLLFYTDGVIESTRDLAQGEARLRAAAAHPELLSSDAPATIVRALVLEEDACSDDVAILAVRIGERASTLRRWVVATDDAAGAAEARRAYLDALGCPAASRDALFACEMIFGELLGNAVRHAPGAVEIVLDLDERPVLHVIDEGCGFTLVPRLPTELLSERGRGLFLIWSLSEDFNVEARPGRGSHARVVLPIRIARSDGDGQFSRITS